jgi:tetrahydromethanopterin S-methyltransferase subunit G
MPTPTIIETDLREVLAEMNKKLDTISKDVNQVQERLATVEIKVDNMEKQIEKVKGDQSRQVWALICILFIVVIAIQLVLF